MTPDEKELVDLMNANTETVDELMYRLRYAPPEALDAIYNGVLHALRLSGKATRVFSIQGGDDENAFSWAYRGKGRRACPFQALPRGLVHDCPLHRVRQEADRGRGRRDRRYFPAQLKSGSLEKRPPPERRQHKARRGWDYSAGVSSI